MVRTKIGGWFVAERDLFNQQCCHSLRAVAAAATVFRPWLWLSLGCSLQFHQNRVQLEDCTSHSTNLTRRQYQSHSLKAVATAATARRLWQPACGRRSPKVPKPQPEGCGSPKAVAGAARKLYQSHSPKASAESKARQNRNEGGKEAIGYCSN